jgi:hypothetical protein
MQCRPLLTPAGLFDPSIAIFIEDHVSVAHAAYFDGIGHSTATGSTDFLVYLSVEIVVEFVTDFGHALGPLHGTPFVHSTITVRVFAISAGLVSRRHITDAIQHHAVVVAIHESTPADSLSQGDRRAAITGLPQPAIAITGLVDGPIAIVIESIAVISAGAITALFGNATARATAVGQAFVGLPVTIFILAITDLFPG